MVLDTNVKEYKYSIWTKIGCILLALVTFTASAQIIVKTVLSAIYCEDMESSDWTESNAFQNSFSSDLNYIIQNGYSEQMNEDFKKSLTAQKDTVVENAYNQYLKLKSIEKKEWSEDEDYYDPETDEWVNVTTAYFDDEIQVEIKEVKSDVSTTNAIFSINY